MAATRAERPRRLHYLFLLISIVIGGAAVASAGVRALAGWEGPLPGWVLTVAAVGNASFACRYAALRGDDPVVRRFWLRLAGAAGILTAGLAVRGAAQGGIPYAGHLALLTCTAALVLLGSALMGLPSARRTRHEWLALALDAGTVMAALALFTWQAAVWSGIEVSAALHPVALVWLVLAGALGALTVVRVGLALPCPIRHLTLGLLGLGLLSGAVVSGLSAGSTDDEALLSAPLASAFWVVAVVVQLRSAGRAPRPRRHSARLPFNVLPYVAAVAVGAMVLAVPTTHAARGVLHGAVLFVALVLARQIIASYHSARLLRQVDAGMLELRRHEQRFRSMVQQAADIIMITSTDGTIEYASPALRQLVGLADDNIGAQITDYVHPDDLPVLTHHVVRVASVPAGVATFQVRVSDAAGSWRWLEIISTNLLADPAVRGIVSNARDITDMLRYQDQLAHQATHDELTGLPNRALLLDRVRVELGDGSSGRAGVALVDLDDFKAINDRLGHDVGDALLISVGDLLSGCVGPRDTVARLGGDEFAVVFADTPPEDATDALDRIMSAFDTPIVAAGYDLLVQASIGLANGVTGDDATELLRRADVALYAAKELGKGRHTAYDPDMDNRSIKHAQVGAELRQAMDAGDQLYLLYQPIVGLPDGRITGVEALVRWLHPVRGVVPPTDFIPLAERTGLIIPLGRWILREACGQAARWADDPNTGQLTVSVNVSARQLRDPKFPSELAGVLTETGLDPARLTVEVTETAVFDSDVAVEALRAVHDLGVRVALDDFGTGHSSLGLLRSCPVDILKVDKSFVDGVTGTAEQAAIAISLIQITSTMRLAAVAEGVETAEQAHTLHRLGYRLAQGFHFARPLPSAEVTMLAAQPASQAKPQPAGQAKPHAADHAEPQPASQAKPHAADHAEPQPASQAKPHAASQAKPQPAGQAEPRTAEHAEPQPAAV